MDEARGITKVELAALRNADDICFDYERDHGHAIRAIKRATEAAPGNGFDQTMRIPVTGHLTCYRTDGDGCDHAAVATSAFAHCGSAKFMPNLQTAIRHIRPGDEVALHWTAADQNSYVTEAGLFTDSLDIVVSRRGKDGRIASRDTYAIRHQTGPDNSARMIRFAATAGLRMVADAEAM